MKINNLSLPHPVLGIGDDVTGAYSVECHVELGRDLISIHVKQLLNNRTLEKLIVDHKAAFNIEVHCRQTIYRKSFISREKEFKISIPATQLLNKVEVNFYVNAITDIADYQIEGSNQDYTGYSFEINKGDILAYSNPITFPAEKDWQAFMAVTSFMEIQEGEEEEGPLLFDLTHNDKVIILMAKKDYGKYNSFKSASYLNPVFHSSIAFPALMYALSVMRRTNSDYEDSKWYQNLEWRLEHDEDLKGFDLERLDHIPEIAQAILKNPLTRSLSGMENIQKNINLED